MHEPTGEGGGRLAIYEVIEVNRLWVVFIESRRGQKKETGYLGILHPIYSRELNHPDVTHARAAVCVQWPASISFSISPSRLWVVRCFIEATLEHSQAARVYVQAGR